MLTDHSGARHLLSPLTFEEFFTRHWEAEPAHLRDGGARLARLGLTAARMREVFARAAQILAIFPDPYHQSAVKHGARAAILIEAASADAALAAGATLAAYNVHTLDPGVAALVASIKADLGLAGRVNGELWLSPPGSGVPVHFDGTASWIVQIEGRKRWRASRSPALRWPESVGLGTVGGGSRTDFVGGVEAERQDWESDIAAYDEANFLDVEMAPGDVLYVPAGTWHTTEAAGDASSFALNIHFQPTSPLGILNQVCARALRPQASWRAIPPAPPTAEGSISPALEAYFDDRIRDLEETLAFLKTPSGRASIAREWARDVAARDAPSAVRVHHLDVATDAPGVEPGDTLRVREGIPPVCVSARDDDGRTTVTLFYNAQEVSFDDPELLTFGHGLAATTRFVARAAAGWLPPGEPDAWARARELLEALVAQGVLEHVR